MLRLVVLLVKLCLTLTLIFPTQSYLLSQAEFPPGDANNINRIAAALMVNSALTHTHVYSRLRVVFSS